MKITKSQLKQTIKEEISKIINEAYTDDMQKPIRPGDFLQLVYNSDVEETLIHNFGQTKPTVYEMDHGGRPQDVEARMIVQVLNPQPRQEEITETLNEDDSKRISKIAQVLQAHYPNSIPVVAEYLKTIDMLNKEFTHEETPAANALYDALYNMGDIEQPIMRAVRQLMKNKE